MTESLGNKNVTGILWSLTQRFGVMLISFISNIVLARILSPEDFGLIGMLYIFIAISNTFVDGGFGSALIQKKNPTQEDYSTIFYWNIIVAVLLTIFLYTSAPSISRFYRMPILTDLLRVMGLVLIINAFSIIQNNILIKQFKFRKLAIINITAAILSTTFAIFCAYGGWGVWSLVAKNLAGQILITVLLWITTLWVPNLKFSVSSLKFLGNFGGMMLLANLVETAYNEAQGLIIGKIFSARDLGYYTQAKRLEEIPTNGISTAINQVTFTIFSSMQDAIERMKYMVRQNIKLVSFVIIPAYTILIIVARPLIVFLFTDKWLNSVHLFQILCLVGMIYPLNTINTNVIRSLGKSRIYFNLQFLKRLGAICIILLSVNFGLEAMMWSLVLNAYLIFLINVFFSRKMIGYSIKEQFEDITFPFICSTIVGLGVSLFFMLGMNIYLCALFQIIVFAIVFLLISKLCKKQQFDWIQNIVIDFIKR